MATNIILYNNVLNRLDPCKDAMNSNLNNRDHGERVFNAINTAFPRIQGQPNDGLATNNAISDTKPTMKQLIMSNYTTTPMYKNRQQLLRLKVSPNGADNRRFQDIYVAHDAGLSPSGLFSSTYYLVNTPGSTLDPALKIRARDIDISSPIETPHNFPKSKLVAIGMGTAITNDIRFTINQNGTYSYAIPILGNDMDVSFGVNFTAIGNNAQYFAGNATKNAYISQNDNNEEIAKYIITKEIGDTLQVCWLLHIISRDINVNIPDQLQLDNTAIMSNDTVVLYRCFVNNLSVFASSGNTVTYYPAMDEVTYNAQMKAKIIQDVVSFNTATIAMLNNLAYAHTSENSTYMGRPFTTDRLTPLINTLTSLLTSINTEILNYLDSIDITTTTVAAFSELSSKLIFVSPIIKKGNAYKGISTFRRFLPYNNIRPDIGTLNFNIAHIYEAHIRDMSAERIAAVCKYITDFTQNQQQQQGGAYDAATGIYTPDINPVPYTAEEFNYIKTLIYQNDVTRNLDIPGFRAYIMLTYFPEVLYIGYAAYTYNKGQPSPVYINALLTEGQLLRDLTDSFTSLVGDSFENKSGANATMFKFLDVAASVLSIYALPVIQSMIGYGQYSVITTYVAGNIAADAFSAATNAAATADIAIFTDATADAAATAATAAYNAAIAEDVAVATYNDSTATTEAVAAAQAAQTAAIAAAEATNNAAIATASIIGLEEDNIYDIWGIYQMMYHNDLVANMQNSHDNNTYNPFDFVINESAVEHPAEISDANTSEDNGTQSANIPPNEQSSDNSAQADTSGNVLQNTSSARSFLAARRRSGVTLTQEQEAMLRAPTPVQPKSKAEIKKRIEFLKRVNLTRKMGKQTAIRIPLKESNIRGILGDNIDSRHTIVKLDTPGSVYGFKSTPKGFGSSTARFTPIYAYTGAGTKRGGARTTCRRAKRRYTKTRKAVAVRRRRTIRRRK